MARKLLMLFVVLALASAAFAQDVPEVHKTFDVPLVRMGEAPALRDTPPAPFGSAVKRIVPNHFLAPSVEHQGIQLDAALQTSAYPSVNAPSASKSFAGIGLANYTVNSVPPDTNGDVGATQYVQTVNTAMAIFDKSTGAILWGPSPTNTLWSGFGGLCQTNNDGDPTVTYDQIANRWIVAQFALAPKGGKTYYECVAVSKTSDALNGGWYLYAYAFSKMNDYPKLAIWPSADAYFATYNMFGRGSFAGAQVCAMQRSKMLIGAAAPQQCVQLSTSYYSLLAADLDGTIQPANGTDEYVISAYNGVKMWRFHVNFGGSGTMTGPTSIAVAGYTEACNGSGGSCVPQKPTTSGTAAKSLDTLSSHAMNRFAYRKFADGHEAAVANHTVYAAGANAVRWYELRPSGSALAVYQQGTYSPDSNHRWMASVAMDKNGSIGMGYSVSSSTMNPAIAFTVHDYNDGAGSMQAETTLISGTGSQNQYSRWGDYSNISTDTDDCTFYFTTEYLTQDGCFNWSTRIGSFKLSSCN